MSTFMFKYLIHDLRLLKFNKPLHFFAEMPLVLSEFTIRKSMKAFSTTVSFFTANCCT